MRARWRPHIRRELSPSLVMATCLCLATGGFVWLGYVATREWQRHAALVPERQAMSTLPLLAQALNRDMRGAHASLLFTLRAEHVAKDPPHHLRHAVARSFRRFPYLEWFFVASGVDGGGSRTWLFTRADRPPPWDRDRPKAMEPYPVVVTRDSPALQDVVDQVRRSVPGRPFAIVEREVHGTPYQIVLTYLRGGSRIPALDVAGFAVNLRWVRERYFQELLDEVAHLEEGSDESVSLAVLDEMGAVVAETGSPAPSRSQYQRSFPLLFFDDAMTSLLPRDRAEPAQWTMRTRPMNDAMANAAARAARGTFGLLALAAAASVIGVLLTARAVQVRAELAAMKSDFVSTVTHELKAPLAVIRMAGDTLAMGRYTSSESIAEYARLASEGAVRLSRLVDNLLTYARVTDVGRDYRLEALEVAELVEDALQRFRPRLVELGFETRVDVPLDLPRIRADRMAVLQALDNLVDNAIKYSTVQHLLEVRAYSQGTAVRLEVVDRGRGIPEGELPCIFDRFYRGRGAAPEGSGLGLAIVSRVVADHGGRVEVSSVVGKGTTVALLLPMVGP